MKSALANFQPLPLKDAARRLLAKDEGFPKNRATYDIKNLFRYEKLFAVPEDEVLASYNEETKTTARKQTGSFYTPRPIVDYMVDESLKAHLTREEILRISQSVTFLRRRPIHPSPKLAFTPSNSNLCVLCALLWLTNSRP